MYSIKSNQAPYCLRFAALVLALVMPLPNINLLMAEEIPPDTTIDTGEAVSILNSETIVNENETDQFVAPEEVVNEGSSATSTEEGLYFEFVDLNTVDINATNSATTTTNATSSAETGQNNIATEGMATIVTGDAFAVANIVNLVNTNILNSNGFIQFFTTFGLSTFDIRNLFSVFDETNSVSTPPCVGVVCGEGGVIYQSTTNNVANITNNVVVRANSGQNTATGGATSINTGDAYAIANVLNMANTNITDSNYLVVSINNLGDMMGDLVLPKAELLEDLFKSIGFRGSSNNTNTAEVNNNTNVVADTGDNEAAGGNINTGTAVADASINNQVNQNLVGADSFLLLLRVHGNWSGDILGLPNNMLWSESAGGVTIYSSDDQSFGNPDGSLYQTSNNNTATINNNISVFALTGANKISSQDGGDITTGDAYASASISNLANLNILSQNWALLIFDIFGDWDGNIAFGRPDLWVGVKASSPDTPIMPGSAVDYTFTVSNLGDTRASNVSIENEFNKDTLIFTDKDIAEKTPLRSAVRINIGDLAPGESKDITYRTTVNTALPKSAITPIPLTANVTAKETEDDYENNSDTIQVESGVINRSSGGGGSTQAAKIKLTKIGDTDSVVVPDSVNYEIVIENSGGPLYNAILFDTLRDASGKVVHEEFWNLGTILKSENITVTYTTNFSASSSAGLYTNTAEVVGNHRQRKANSNNVYNSNMATSTVMIVSNNLFPLVAGIVETCVPYLTKFSRQASTMNDGDEVKKLQTFLNEHLGLSIAASGIFDYDTHVAVMNFQEKYRAEVLDPWGMTVPSGYVYLTTRKTINEIYCKNKIAFPLTPTEEWVLRQGRAQLLGLRAF